MIRNLLFGVAAASLAAVPVTAHAAATRSATSVAQAEGLGQANAIAIRSGSPVGESEALGEDSAWILPVGAILLVIAIIMITDDGRQFPVSPG